MLTGDGRATAEAVGRALGIGRIEAEVLPERKAEVVRQLQADGRVVAMAGDGVNDAPALAAAHVGIAMGTGTDVAIESAGITLVKGDLAALVRARRLSRATLANIRQNLFWAFAYNVAAIPVAAGALYPWLGVLLSPMLAAAAMAFSSVTRDRERAPPAPRPAVVAGRALSPSRAGVDVLQLQLPPPSRACRSPGRRAARAGTRSRGRRPSARRRASSRRRRCRSTT